MNIKNVNFGIIRIKLKIDTYFKYTIKTEMSKVTIDPTAASCFQGQRL